jgi:hypothetical protein
MPCTGTSRTGLYTNINLNDDNTEAVVKITVDEHEDGIDVIKARIGLDKDGKLTLEPFGKIEFESDEDD